MRLVRMALGFAFGLYALFAAMALGLLIGTIGVAPFAVFPRGRREPYAMVAASAWAWVLVHGVLLARVEVRGDSGLQAGEGALIFCNHRSWLDPLVLMYALRSNGLSKRIILWLPVIGLYGWLSGAVFFDRRSRAQRTRARKEVLDLVQTGHRVQVFPEGTRSRDGRLREKVYLTLALDAFRRGLAVVPCAIHGSERVMPVPTVGAFPLQRATLSIQTALRPDDYDNAHTFAQACWQAVTQQFRALEAEATG